MEKEKIKIGIDLDDVIVNTIDNFIKFCKSQGLDLNPTDFCPYYKCEAKGIDDAKNFELFKGFNETSLCVDIDFLDSAKESLEELRKGADLFLITSRPTRAIEKTNVFLEDQFGKDYFQEIIFSGKSHPDGKTKSEICDERGISVFIEDRKKYALACAEKGIKVFLIDKPWNQDCKHKNIIRVKNWKEIMEKLK